MRRLILLVTAIFLLAVVAPLSVFAQSGEEEGTLKVGPRLTLDLGDISDAYDGTVAIGADARYKNPNLPVAGNAAFDFYFAAENVSVYTLDLNALYPIETETAFSPYVGAGLGYTNVSFDTNTQFGAFSGSDTGLNLVGGAEFEVGSLQPFAQAQFTLGNLSRFGITGGLLFSL